MKYRKLRIVWSLVWGVAAMLLAVLGVRSYSHINWVHHQYSASHYFRATIARGSVVFETREYWSTDDAVHWNEERLPANVTPEFPGLRQLPYWIVPIFFGFIGAAPWLRWQFSLRTLLIVTTLVAVGLGLVVYALRN